MQIVSLHEMSKPIKGDNFHEKSRSFSGKNKKNIINLSSAEFAHVSGKG